MKDYAIDDHKIDVEEEAVTCQEHNTAMGNNIMTIPVRN